MRISILSSWYPTVKSPLYGIFVQAQSTALAVHHEVDVLLLERAIIPNIEIINKGQFTVIKKGCAYLPNRNEFLLKIWAHQYYLLFKENHKKKRYDVIHCHDHYGAYAGWYINKKMNIPYVVTIHNSTIQKLTLVDWKKSYLPKVLDNANKVIAVGHKLREILQKNFTNQEVIILPNLIDTDIFKPIEIVRPKYPFKFLFIGDLDENKGVMRMLKAFNELSNKCNLHIIGRGPLKDEAEAYISSKKIDERVILQDQIPNAELPKIYNSAHVYVSLSKEETFGITVLEAMSCGLPIIYTKSGGPEHIVINHGCIQTSMDDIGLISKSLEEAIITYEDIDRAKIRQHVLDNYSSQSIINQLLLIYKKCINEA